MKRVILAALFFLSLLASCAPIRPNLGMPVSADFAGKLITHWRQETGQIHSVQGLATVDVQAPLNSVKGTQVLLAEMPDRLRAETLTPFGVPLLTMAVNGEHLGVFLPTQNLYYLGTATPENLGVFINLPLEPTDLVSILLYQPALINAWKMEAFTLNDGGWLLVRYGSDKRQELVFNPEKRLVEVVYFEGNELKLKATYAELVNGVTKFPAQIKLALPEKHATISLDFTDFETNGKIKESLFELRPTPGAKVVYLPN